MIWGYIVSYWDMELYRIILGYGVILYHIGIWCYIVSYWDMELYCVILGHGVILYHIGI